MQNENIPGQVPGSAPADANADTGRPPAGTQAGAQQVGVPVGTQQAGTPFSAPAGTPAVAPVQPHVGGPAGPRAGRRSQPRATIPSGRQAGPQAAIPAGRRGGTRTGAPRRAARAETSGHPPVTISRRLLVALLALAAAAGSLLTLLVSRISGCTARRQGGDTSSIDATSGAWVDPYDWDRMRNDENGLLAYYDTAGNKLSEAGIDVAEFDGEVDWGQVKAAGVDFVMVRVGYRGYSQGTVNLDSQFHNYIVGASQAGLKVGAYFFSQATTVDEAVEEANFTLAALSEAGVELTYPVAFDEELYPEGSAEARTNNLDGDTETLTSIAAAFLEVVTGAGYEGVVYGNQHDLGRLNVDDESISGYELWYAEYDILHPTGHYDMAMWQYKSTGVIPGVNEGQPATDLNIRFVAKGKSDS